MRFNRIKMTLMAAAVVFAASAVALYGPAPETAAAQGAIVTLYKSKCASCHGVDGKANTAKGRESKTRDFHAEEVKKMSEAQMLQVTLKGKNKMPGFEKQLGADKCKELVAYIRETFK
ncbi:MAG: cytochrome c [Blastocatellales bacterium]|nr:cytochrome c [Blastocatellales bacterium]